MEKKRWSLIFIGLCLGLVFSVSSVEAQKDCDFDEDGFIKDTNKCHKQNPTLDIDCNDDDKEVPLNEPCPPLPPPSPPEDFPIIAVVSNSSGTGSGGAVGHITSELLLGIYTNVSVRNFNRWTAADLRKRFDVLHVAYQSTRSIRLDWDKLVAFMKEGGGILIEDPANIEDLEDLEDNLNLGLMLTHVEAHPPGDLPTIVEFAGLPGDANLPYDEPEEILARFTMGQGSINDSGYFADGDGTVCADNFEGNTGPKRGLGFGCLVNNHITFATPQENDEFDELMPLLRLEGSDGTEAVALYGEGGTFGPGRIILQGTDHGFHGGGGPGEFNDNHFCLLTNEIIWLSQLLVISPVAADNPTDAKLAIDNCVANSQARRDLIGPE